MKPKKEHLEVRHLEGELYGVFLISDEGERRLEANILAPDQESAIRTLSMTLTEGQSVH